MANQIKMSFGSGNSGLIESKNGKTTVSYEGNGLAPYDLFLGGYASCLHATFKGITSKKKVRYDSATYEVVGIKREEVPTLLKELTTIVTFTGVTEENKKSIEKSMEMAEKYCSISATIKMIAEMKLEIIFE